VYVLQARDLGHARALASMTPGIDGEVEVRPILRFARHPGIVLTSVAEAVTAARRHEWAYAFAATVRRT